MKEAVVDTPIAAQVEAADLTTLKAKVALSAADRKAIARRKEGWQRDPDGNHRWVPWTFDSDPWKPPLLSEEAEAELKRMLELRSTTVWQHEHPLIAQPPLDMADTTTLLEKLRQRWKVWRA